MGVIIWTDAHVGMKIQIGQRRYMFLWNWRTGGFGWRPLRDA